MAGKPKETMRLIQFLTERQRQRNNNTKEKGIYKKKKKTKDKADRKGRRVRGWRERNKLSKKELL